MGNSLTRSRVEHGRFQMLSFWRGFQVTIGFVRKAFVAAVCLSILSLQLAAQTSYGSIVGTVTDSTGATIPGAVAALTNLGTSERRTAQSDADGNYQFVNLLPGQYKVEIEKTGFKHLTRDQVQVEVLSTARVDAALEVGEASETVRVSGSAPLLQTENASVSQVVEGREVTELPLNGRNVMDLIELAPGVVPHGLSQGQTTRSAWANYQIAGGMAGEGKTLVDGATLMTGIYNGQAYAPIQDAVQEFQVQSNNASPEFGGSLNGIFTLSTKSGSNAFHGAGYEYLRNRVFNANEFFSNQAGIGRSPFIQNQPGGNLGGRIIRDKTFFFVAYERFFQNNGTSTAAAGAQNAAAYVATVPTPAERAGNFSNLETSSGAPTVIYDPASTCITCPAGQQRTPFPGNMIPLSRFDPTAAIYEKYWPLPNTTGAPFTNINNYTDYYPAPNNRLNDFFRIDHNISDKQRLFASYAHWDNSRTVYDPLGLGIYATRLTNANQAILADTYTLNPSTVLDAHLSYLTSKNTNVPNTVPVDYTTLGWPASFNSQLTQRTLPQMVVTGFTSSDVGSNGQQKYEYSYVGSVASSLTKIIGRHTIKFGGEYDWLPTPNAQTATNNFSFTNSFTAANPLSPGNTGNAFASFLLGLGSSGTVGANLYPMFTIHEAGLYVGDTFRMSRHLTLNYGVRWEYPGGLIERFNDEVVFMTKATNPALQSAGLNYPGDVVLVNSQRYPDRSNEMPHWRLFAPRIGVAYRLDDKTVIRSGFGISYAPGSLVQDVTPVFAPINKATNAWVPTLNGGLTPVNTLNNPFPGGITLPEGRNPGYETGLLGTSIILPVPSDAWPYMMNWNFGFQRQFGGNNSFDISYVASRGVHLVTGTGQGLNQLPDQYDSLGSQLLNQVANPFYGLVSGSGPQAGQTIQYGQRLLPYPQYLGINDPTAAGFESAYHSLQVKFERRLKAGGTILVTYSWSKNTGDAEPIIASTDEDLKPGAIQDYDNLKGEHSLLTYDVPQRLSVSYVVDLPMGKGKRFLGNVSGVADKLVSGWGLNGITSLQSGYPLPLIAQATTLSTYFNAGTPRPNVTAGCDKTTSGSSQSRITKWFDTSCFSAPSTFGFGSEGRVDPNIRAAGINNFDLALFKKIPINDRIQMEFLAEAFNLFNRVQFGFPGTTLGTPQFGVVSTQEGNPREIQLALRIAF